MASAWTYIFASVSISTARQSAFSKVSASTINPWWPKRQASRPSSAASAWSESSCVPKSGVGRAADVGAAADRDHVVEGGDRLPVHGERGRVDRVGVQDHVRRRRGPSGCRGGSAIPRTGGGGRHRCRRTPSRRCPSAPCRRRAALVGVMSRPSATRCDRLPEVPWFRPLAIHFAAGPDDALADVAVRDFGHGVLRRRLGPSGTIPRPAPAAMRPCAGRRVEKNSACCHRHCR